MGDHVARGANSTRAATADDERDEWRDGQITAVDKRVEKATVQGMPPLQRGPAPDKRS
jgi:hypothetical protein